ncbi:hypothetical protein Celaphus_00015347 [Cervus elaphus hippelaphus]|uniref:Uncharacterized protein n=1 Tax=Cervus elaphus hippelaphus TaxID=46360 RepID=A0A212CSW6_CEREH|nr:hypothetical protein Celaphus_00015347 [Cervus elaphus hippelaphus]
MPNCTVIVQCTNCTVIQPAIANSCGFRWHSRTVKTVFSQNQPSSRVFHGNDERLPTGHKCPTRRHQTCTSIVKEVIDGYQCYMMVQDN